ncbi:MAG: PCRF domain-containing protein, partial [Campylobacteraceae bacterium]|nr:PCRF domain-containing protein [Campylobacteraceae bacterium]
MLKDKLLPFINRYNEISSLLASQATSLDIKKMTELSKEQSALEEIYAKANEYIRVSQGIDDNRELLEDAELGELAKDELKNLEKQALDIESEIKILLLPKDPNDDKNIFLEIRAGTGGDEAALFSADLFKAYIRYAESRRWKVEIVSQSDGVMGGLKEVIVLIQGKGAYSRLKYEGGT